MNRSAAELLPATFEGLFVRLRPVARRDHPNIFAQRISLEFLTSDNHAVAVPDFERWEAQELPDMLQSGPVRGYRVDGRDRRCFLDLRLELGQDGQTAETLLATLDYLFKYVNLRKVYIETITMGEPFSRWLARVGFVEEARLREYVWRGRDYSDLVYYGLERDVWAVQRRNLEISLAVSGALPQVTDDSQ